MEALGAEDAELVDRPGCVRVEEVARRPALCDPCGRGDLALRRVGPGLVVEVEAADTALKRPHP
eukprot:5100907-Lingulodinium_polyedra.AAC.1